jgi:hypothetical protein
MGGSAALDACAPLEFEKVSLEDVHHAPPLHPSIDHRQATSDSVAEEVLHDNTATWLAQLPAGVRPRELGRRCKGVANRLAKLWTRAELFNGYIDELLGRKSASPSERLGAELEKELRALKAYRALQSGGMDTLRPETAAWLEALPAHVRPGELACQFPRIANKLQEIWKRPAICEEYIEDLVVDRRGGRKGFPAKVATEIVELRNYYADLYPRERGCWKDGDFAR